MKNLLLILFSLLCCPAVKAEVVWFDGTNPVTYQVEGKVDAVVQIALRMFCDDMELVTGHKTVESKNAVIRIVQGKGSDDGFRIFVKDGQVVVEGHNARGTAYGVMELSRMAGVSPWVWWGDVRPHSRSLPLSLPDTFRMEHTPSVEYRGIFINDEDWSLRRWSKDDMGPQTYKRLFELMLRLRANTLWPAMHEGTPGFFTVKGNKEMADSFGIVIGTSHCEPLLRNNVAEWDVKERGAYNYITNRERVQQYWTERLKQVKGSEQLFCPQGQVYGIDYSEESVAMSRKKNKSLLESRCFIEQGNVMELPYETGKFDLVTAFETVYFWPDLKQSFSEVFRVLKPGGMFMFSYGLESNATMRYWADQIDAMNLLPMEEISKILADTGFENLQTATKGDYTINIRIQKPEVSN